MEGKCGHEFVIEQDEARRIASESGITIHQVLPALVKRAQALARPPISDYRVGAVGIGSSGRIYFGVNLEFPGLPLHHSVHAEQFLVTNLALHSEPSLTHLAVSAAPCGHCRQFLQEIRCAPNIQVLVTSDGSESSFRPLGSFFPNRFGPDDLLDEDVPLALERSHNGLSLVSVPELSNGCLGPATLATLREEALVAANRSHAPYSQCPSGMALLDSNGRMYRGSYIESAAYNPSLGPVQAALIDYVASGGGGYEQIVAAVLVEREDAIVCQKLTARLLLQSISSRCEFKTFYCSSHSCRP